MMKVFMKKLSKPARKRRSFTPELKAEAVHIAQTSGKSVAQPPRRDPSCAGARIVVSACQERAA
jgi:hypothetical protein